MHRKEEQEKSRVGGDAHNSRTGRREAVRMTIRAGVVRDAYELEQPIVMGAKEREDSQRRPQMACQRGIKVKEGKSGGKASNV